MKGRLLSLAVAAAIGYCLLLLWLWAAQRSMIYFPAPAPGEPPEGAEEVRIRTSDGLELAAWFRPAVGQKRGALLLLHGNGGNRADFYMEQQDFALHGYDSLSLDWRGYGGNPGQPDEAGLLVDASAGLRALAELSGLGRQRIAVAGFSLGAAVAVQLAAEEPVGAVIALAPFTSLPAAAARHYPWAPVRLLVRDRFDALSAAPRVRAPVLVVFGQADTLIPPEQGRVLAATLPLGRFEQVAGAGHNDLLFVGGVELRARMRAFLDEHLGG